MFKKLNIKIFKIPNLYNSGFIIDYNNNNIVNTENNYTLPLPFNTSLINTLYFFEILLGPDYLILTLILNCFLCDSFVDRPHLFGSKKELFKILNNRQLPQQSFKKFNNIFNILSLDSYEFNSPALININKNKFIDISTENIEHKDVVLKRYRPNLFMVVGSSLDLRSNYEYCIVDTISNLIPEFTLHSENCDNIHIEDLYNWPQIHISDTLFFSKKYSNQYHKYHSNYKSSYAYDNYKNHFNTLDNGDKCFNIELMENKVFILKNIDIKKIIHHPVLHSNNSIIIINDRIKKKDIVHLELIFNKRFGRESNIKYNDSLYLDPCKHYIYNLYMNLTEIENLLKIENSIIVIYKDDIPDLYENKSQLELYQYNDGLLIENITASAIIINNNISILDIINIFGGMEIYNIKRIYKISK